MSEKEDLKARLVALEGALQAKSPFVLEQMAPPATAEQLAELEAALGVRVEPLEVWYGWHNGCSGPATDILPLGRMLPISEALADRRMVRSIPFVDRKRRSALKILEDAAGDGFFLDVAIPRPRVFYHMLEDPFPQDYGTLAQFVSFIAEVHAAGLASAGEGGVVNFDLDRYAEIEADYLRRIGGP
jgi:hypothetical protein